MRCQGNQSRVCQLVAVLLLSVGTSRAGSSGLCAPISTLRSTCHDLVVEADHLGGTADRFNLLLGSLAASDYRLTPSQAICMLLLRYRIRLNIYI